MEEERKKRSVSETAINDFPHLLIPNDLNSLGTVHGRTIYGLVDSTGGAMAEKHSCGTYVTKHSELEFLASARQGDMLLLNLAINRVFNSSMEIGVKIFAKNPRRRKGRWLIVSAYFYFVSVEKLEEETTECEELRSVPIGYQVDPVTEVEKRRFNDAGVRRKERDEKKRQKAARQNQS